jgi:hypothetical protein
MREVLNPSSFYVESLAVARQVRVDDGAAGRPDDVRDRVPGLLAEMGCRVALEGGWSPVGRTALETEELVDVSVVRSMDSVDHVPEGEEPIEGAAGVQPLAIGRQREAEQWVIDDGDLSGCALAA